VFQEVLQSISKNKLRSFLSGFTVIFAILLFTVLLGISNGLNNAFKTLFNGDSENAIFISGKVTTMPFKGYKAGRKIDLHEEDFHFIKDNFQEGIEKISVRVVRNFQVKFGTETNAYSARGVHPDHRFIEETILSKGRFISIRDVNSSAQVVVLGELIIEDLKIDNPIGKNISIDGYIYKIVGVSWDEGESSESRTMYIPYTTLLNRYSKDKIVNQIVLTYDSDYSVNKAVVFGNDIKDKLFEKYFVHPNDIRAINIDNSAKGKKEINQFTDIISLMIFIIGLGTLIAGIVSITNILIYVVKERTKEIGVRKAIGAKPIDIIKMVVLESILITSVSGYLGLLLGVFVVKIMNGKLDSYFIYNPSVDTSIVFKASIILVFSGIFAGYIPARRAAKIKPIEALRDE
jgi:putative ABC transport system permease protein